jgi:hypothetical protein
MMVAMETIKFKNAELSPVAQKALVLIGEYLGQYTADIYQNFYQEKEDQVILESVNELLEEVVGVSKTSQLMADKFGGLFKKSAY